MTRRRRKKPGKRRGASPVGRSSPPPAPAIAAAPAAPALPDERLIHRKHGVALFWTVVGGLITAIVMQVYQNSRPPQRVLLANADTITRDIRDADSLAGRYMAEMVNELRRLRSSGTVVQQGKPLTKGTIAGVRAEIPADVINLPVLSRFVLPSPAKGWTSESINPFAVYECPESKIPARTELDLAVSLRNPSLAGALSPLEFALHRPETVTRTVVLFDQQYEMLPNNRILFTAPTEPGHYTIEFGFFVRADVGGAYPKKYSGSCDLTVLADEGSRPPS